MYILKSISDCYFDTRYPGENYFELTEEEAVKCFKSTVRVYCEIKRLIKMELGNTVKLTKEFKES